MQDPEIVEHDPISGLYQPHLRIILASHNRVGGSDLNSFYAPVSGCGTQIAAADGAFMVVPLARGLIVDDWSPSGTMANAYNRSLRACGIPLP